MAAVATVRPPVRRVAVVATVRPGGRAASCTPAAVVGMRAASNKGSDSGAASSAIVIRTRLVIEPLKC